jgi:SagB-type dehydrogenase family enzyme
MTRGWAATLLALALVVTGCASSAPTSVLGQTERFGPAAELPPAETTGNQPLETALSLRRSVREFANVELSPEVIGQLFWAGQGETDAAGHRSAPSAGARYPLELYALTADDLAHYLPEGHRAERRRDSTSLMGLADLAFGQEFVSTAPVVVVITGVQARTEAEYGAVAGDLMNREAGHVAQNILLQATAMGLAAVPVGGFDPAAIARLLALGPGEEVLYLIPVGHPR